MTQFKTTLEQLEEGIRYLDYRTMPHKVKIYIKIHVPSNIVSSI